MSQSESALDRLENSLVRVLRRLRDLQTENKELKEKVYRLRKELEEVKKENETKGQRIERMGKNHLRIRAGVEKIIRKINTLEEPIR